MRCNDCGTRHVVKELDIVRRNEQRTRRRRSKHTSLLGMLVVLSRNAKFNNVGPAIPDEPLDATLVEGQFRTFFRRILRPYN
jgi:hypothetical protein